MRFLLTLTIILSSYAYGNSQVAVSARYLSNSAEGFENYDQEFKSGLEFGLGYWFRLKNKRMEFTPEVSIAFLDSDRIANSSIGFNANILIYPLDFHSDCDACPTFSKEGGLVKKGFYWILSPGLWMFRGDDMNLSLSEREFMTYRIGAGAGLDIGVVNLLTLSPFVMYNIVGSGFKANGVSNNLSQIHLGVRATLRFDKNKW